MVVFWGLKFGKTIKQGWCHFADIDVMKSAIEYQTGLDLTKIEAGQLWMSSRKKGRVGDYIILNGKIYRDDEIVPKFEGKIWID